MEDLAGKLSVEKGNLFNTSENVSRTIFLLTQEILGLYCFYFVIQYHYVVIKPFVFMFCQPWCAFVKGYSHKRTESSISARSLESTHKHVSYDGVTAVYTCFQVN